MKKQNKYTGGTCYTDSFDFVMDNPDWSLVHGVAVVTAGPHEGKEFGHAWAEKGDMVMDCASGKQVPKVLYYAIGNIDYHVSYTFEQARKQAVKTKTYGAWDKIILKSLHS